MKLSLSLCAVALAAAPLAHTAADRFAQEPSPAAPDPAQMMERLARYTRPGEEHELLKRFVGDWDVAMSFVVGTERSTSRGSAQFRWKVDGRWIEGSWSGSIMGMPVSQHSWIGYDRFKMSYVWTGISSLDTAMNHAEGDLTPDGKALVLYGTLDEYLTGEHDKMVKYAYRFRSADEFTLEVHDLPIGEVGTLVVEYVFTRAEK